MEQIIFITRRDYNINDPNILITDSLDKLIEFLKNVDDPSMDTENNGLNPFDALPILEQYGKYNESYVIDRLSVKDRFLTPFQHKFFIGANMQYDIKINKVHFGTDIRNVYDIMEVEQILNRGANVSASLEETHLRRLGYPLEEDKAIREEFILMGPNSIILPKHIKYAANDVKVSHKIKDVQEELIDTYKLRHRVYNIAFPCTPILADMCLEGFTLNKEEWYRILQENKKNKLLVERELDQQLIELAIHYPQIKGGKYTATKRNTIDVVQTGLFDLETTISNQNVHNLNYSSFTQLAELFKRLKEPLPEQKDKKTQQYKPSFSEEALEQYKINFPDSKVIPFIKILLRYREFEKRINSFGEIFIKEFIRNPKKYGKKNLLKRGYYRSDTQKVHTIYKQEFTRNGRLSSGGTDIGFYNSQQMIKENKYRHCFTLTPEEIAEGWWISTYDLSGAELVILGSHSQDKALIENYDKDLHSYLATPAYTKIVRYILNNAPPNRVHQELYDLLKLNKIYKSYQIPTGEKDANGDDIKRDPTNEEIKEITNKRVEDAIKNKGIIINKKDFPDIRDPFKNVVYGVNYGAKAPKIAETLNIAVYYAELVLTSMRESLPQAFAYLDRVSNFGVTHGYVIYNDRTNSRTWFPEVLNAWKMNRPISNKDKSSVERFCKNGPISGTQADMIKEAMVEVEKEVQYIKSLQSLNQSLLADQIREGLPQAIKENLKDFDFKWKLQVHDELVVMHKIKEFGDYMGKIMSDTCNLYLKGITMKVSGVTTHYWHKGD